MAISPPRWASNAVPTKKGWVVGRELVRAQKFTQAQIDEFYGKSSHAEPDPVPEHVEEVSVEPEVEVVEVDLSTMTKAQLIEYANANNIEVNPTSLKAVILDTIRQAQ